MANTIGPFTFYCGPDLGEASRRRVQVNAADLSIAEFCALIAGKEIAEETESALICGGCKGVMERRERVHRVDGRWWTWFFCAKCRRAAAALEGE